MDYFETIEKRLDMPKAEKERALRELRSHYAEVAAELRDSGLSLSEAETEAERRMGQPHEVAARLNAARRGVALFPPRDFIPTAFVWGFWAAGVMAGVNFIRMGQTSRGRRLMLVSVGASVLLWTVIGVSYWRWPYLHADIWWRCAAPSAIAIVNAAFGLWLFWVQFRLYRDWLAQHPGGVRSSPYLQWWVGLIGLLGMIAAVVAAGFLIFRYQP